MGSIGAIGGVGVLLTFTAALITFIFSYIKIINDKEQKTTEFRQKWTDLVREEISRSIKCQAVVWQDHWLESKWALGKTTADTETKTLLDGKIEKAQDRILRNIEEYKKSMSCLQISLNPEERECQSLISTIKEIEIVEKRGREALLNIFTSNGSMASMEKTKASFDLEIAKKIEDANDCARIVLKKEWERIKNGEESYRFAKKSSAIVISVGLFVLVVTAASYLTYIIIKPNEKADSNTITNIESQQKTEHENSSEENCSKSSQINNQIWIGQKNDQTKAIKSKITSCQDTRKQ